MSDRLGQPRGYVAAIRRRQRLWGGGRPELLGPGELPLHHVDGDDLRRPGDGRALDAVQADAADAEDHHRLARPHEVQPAPRLRSDEVGVLQPLPLPFERAHACAGLGVVDVVAVQRRDLVDYRHAGADDARKYGEAAVLFVQIGGVVGEIKKPLICCAVGIATQLGHRNRAAYVRVNWFVNDFCILGNANQR